MRGFSLFLICTLVIARVAFAQDSPPDTGAAATESAGKLSPLKAASIDVPKGASAWAVHIIRTGGLTGSPLDISITSEGGVKCASPDSKCPKSISGTDLQALTALVDPKVLRNSKSSLSDLCRDCFVTRITVGHRDDKGKVRTYFAYFDDVTAAKAPFQLVRIATTVAALK